MKARLKRKYTRINEKAEQAIDEINDDAAAQSRWAMIQALVPLGLRAVEAELQAEIASLVGGRYQRGGDLKRWGFNPGSVFLGDQKVHISVPRARNQFTNEEATLKSYKALQAPGVIDDIVLRRCIRGISQRNFEAAAEMVPESFGIKKSSAGKKFIRASAKKLKELMSRDLSDHDIVAIFMDGKCFAENEVVIALGITIEGEKVVLGFVETSTENHIVCKDFLNELRQRGLNMENEILFIIDGGKGLYKGIKETMGPKAIVQRCQWHKRENVVAHLPKELQPEFRGKLQAAYSKSTYVEAKSKLEQVKKELSLINQSSVRSLEEGLEETLTLHRLGLYPDLGKSFKTTNCIENVNKQLAIYTDRVDRWQNSDQRQRWVATTLLMVEPRLRKVSGHFALGKLRTAMAEEIVKKNASKQAKVDVIRRA